MPKLTQACVPLPTIRRLSDRSCIRTLQLCYEGIRSVITAKLADGEYIFVTSDNHFAYRIPLSAIADESRETIVPDEYSGHTNGVIHATVYSPPAHHRSYLWFSRFQRI
jgi:hypothetical protein